MHVRFSHDHLEHRCWMASREVCGKDGLEDDGALDMYDVYGKVRSGREE